MSTPFEASDREAQATQSEYELESPFLDRFEPTAQESGTPEKTESSIWQQLETPFVSRLEMESLEDENPQVQLFARLLAELHDEEFDQAISGLVQEASALYEEKISQEFGDSALQRRAAEEGVWEYLQPLVGEAEALLETISEALQQHNLAQMSEDQLDELFEQFEPSRSDLPPAFEDFLKGVSRKLKKVVKGVSAVAQKGLKVATALATGGISLILPKIKKLVRPLLQRVLKIAIGKLPPALQPFASKLAKSLPGLKEMEDAEEENDEAEFDGEMEELQRELDLYLAESLMAEDMEEAEDSLAEYEFLDEDGAASELDNLQEARSQFIDRMSALSSEADIRPATEDFIPAILPALKIGVKLIGRGRIVNFLAGLVAKLIGRFVPPNLATPLSRAIVDAGLRLVSLETSEDSEKRAVGSAIAATVEETVRQVATLPEEVQEDFELLEAYTTQAFEEAMAANFPSDKFIPELSEAAVNGTWVLMPSNARRKLYKKYTVVFEKILTPQIAAKLTASDGHNLLTFLRDRAGVDLSKNHRARVHIYEAIPGTRLAAIAASERGVPGMGSSGAAITAQLHPLTPEAAAVLLGEPGLGRKIPSPTEKDNTALAVGQRLYYLEIPGVHLRVHPNQRIRRSSRIYATVNCPANRLRVAIYVSETDAQKISSKLRANHPWPEVLKHFMLPFRAFHDPGSRRRGLRIIHEATILEEYERTVAARNQRAARPLPSRSSAAFVAPKPARVLALRPASAALKSSRIRLASSGLKTLIANKISHWSLRKLSDFRSDWQARFIKATESPADGVTVLITFANPGVIPLINRVLRGGPVMPTPAMMPRIVPEARIRIFSGFRRG